MNKISKSLKKNTNLMLLGDTVGVIGLFGIVFTLTMNFNTIVEWYFIILLGCIVLVIFRQAICGYAERELARQKLFLESNNHNFSDELIELYNNEDDYGFSGLKKIHPYINMYDLILVMSYVVFFIIMRLSGFSINSFENLCALLVLSVIPMMLVDMGDRIVESNRKEVEIEKLLGKGQM